MRGDRPGPAGIVVKRALQSSRQVIDEPEGRKQRCSLGAAAGLLLLRLLRPQNPPMSDNYMMISLVCQGAKSKCHSRHALVLYLNKRS